MGNLPDTITERMLLPALGRLTKIRCTSLDLKQAPYSEKSSPAIVMKLLSKFGPLSTFDVKPINKGSTVKWQALACFLCAEDARRASDHFMQAKSNQELGGTKLHVTRMFSLKYSLPSVVFPYLKKQIEEVCAASNDTRTTFFDNKSSWTILINSDTDKSINFTKASLAPILEGEILRNVKNDNRAVWSRHLLSRSYKQAMGGVVSATGGKSATWIDARRQEICLFGPIHDLTELKRSLLKHYTDTMLETHTVPILQSEFAYVLKAGRGVIVKAIQASGAAKTSINIKDQSLLSWVMFKTPEK